MLLVRWKIFLRLVVPYWIDLDDEYEINIEFALSWSRYTTWYSKLKSAVLMSARSRNTGKFIRQVSWDFKIDDSLKRTMKIELLVTYNFEFRWFRRPQMVRGWGPFAVFGGEIWEKIWVFRWRHRLVERRESSRSKLGRQGKGAYQRLIVHCETEAISYICVGRISFMVSAKLTWILRNRLPTRCSIEWCRVCLSPFIVSPFTARRTAICKFIYILYFLFQGDKYEYSQSWGEQMNEVIKPVICIVDIPSGCVTVLDDISTGGTEAISPCLVKPSNSI